MKPKDLLEHLEKCDRTMERLVSKDEVPDSGSVVYQINTDQRMALAQALYSSGMTYTTTNGMANAHANLYGQPAQPAQAQGFQGAQSVNPFWR